jgi:transcriptional regulator with XRE-family HTH domain
MSPAELKAIRKRLGLTQEGLARELELSSMTISRWERGLFNIGRPEAEMIRRYAEERSGKVGAKSPRANHPKSKIA